MNHSLVRLSGLCVFGAAMMCLLLPAQAQNSPAKPPNQSVPSPMGQPSSPNMIHLEPAWPMSPPVTGFDPPKGVRTIRIVPEVSPAGYFVRVSEKTTEAEALASFGDLQTRFPDLIGQRQALVRWIKPRDGSAYHRLLVGPFETSEEASEACKIIKAAGGPCIVQKD